MTNNQLKKLSTNRLIARIKLLRKKARDVETIRKDYYQQLTNDTIKLPEPFMTYHLSEDVYEYGYRFNIVNHIIEIKVVAPIFKRNKRVIRKLMLRIEELITSTDVELYEATREFYKRCEREVGL